MLFMSLVVVHHIIIIIHLVVHGMPWLIIARSSSSQPYNHLQPTMATAMSETVQSKRSEDILGQKVRDLPLYSLLLCSCR
jgi:hypothetical protein